MQYTKKGSTWYDASGRTVTDPALINDLNRSTQSIDDAAAAATGKVAGILFVIFALIIFAISNIKYIMVIAIVGVAGLIVRRVMRKKAVRGFAGLGIAALTWIALVVAGIWCVYDKTTRTDYTIIAAGTVSPYFKEQGENLYKDYLEPYGQDRAENIRAFYAAQYTLRKYPHNTVSTRDALEDIKKNSFGLITGSTLKPGEKVKITGITQNQKWYKVESAEGTMGYIPVKVIKEDIAQPTPSYLKRIMNFNGSILRTGVSLFPLEEGYFQLEKGKRRMLFDRSKPTSGKVTIYESDNISGQRAEADFTLLVNNPPVEIKGVPYNFTLDIDGKQYTVTGKTSFAGNGETWMWKEKKAKPGIF